MNEQNKDDTLLVEQPSAATTTVSVKAQSDTEPTPASETAKPPPPDDVDGLVQFIKAHVCNHDDVSEREDCLAAVVKLEQAIETMKERKREDRPQHAAMDTRKANADSYRRRAGYFGDRKPSDRNGPIPEDPVAD